ncbi:hypothetical protein EDD86DRAFT_207477 [Gorgonomyces haynaldii]|nr:hypothetical protein EDD86DRAFT_207477 [Gorgonomyces haynaldii]
MDDGKTLDYFHKVAQGQKFDFVMKLDQDVFLHPQNLIHNLLKFPKEKVYLGRENLGVGFHAGLAYILSWDLVQFLGQDQHCYENRHFQEDSLVAYCLRHGKQIEGPLMNFQNILDIYDEPESQKGWAHEYTPSTIAIHQLKRQDWFLKAAMHFIPLKVDPALLQHMAAQNWQDTQEKSQAFR